MLRLIRPTIKYKESYIAAEKEFAREEKKKSSEVEKLNKNFKKVVARELGYAKGKRLQKNWVPASVYWLVDGKEYIGVTTIRHRLTPALRKEGGHIGYGIRPSKRKRGYGTKILALALRKVKKMGIKNVLVTCDDDNLGSWKIIEANGGILKNKITIKSREVRRYYIEVK